MLPGVALHVVQRGNDRKACFRVESDYRVYLAQLAEVSAVHGCEVHAYCLMTNHVHLLLTPEQEQSCSRMMRDLGRCYVRYFNRRHGRTGTLWEGRFRSCLVESPDYVLACYRYIELNPVRPGMVDRPDAYPWSSHAANTARQADSLVRPHRDLIAFTCTAYRRLFDQDFDPVMLRAIREATNGGYPLASEAFKSSIIARLGRRMAPGKPGRRAEAG
jgi:putative transposase